jgi:hypothetical protein
VLREKLFVRIRGVRGTRVLPILVLGELRKTRTRLRGELAIRMKLEEMVVAFLRVRRFGGFPVDTLAATTCDERHAHDY